MPLPDFTKELQRLQLTARAGEQIFEIVPKQAGRIIISLSSISIVGVLTVVAFLLFSIFSPPTGGAVTFILAFLTLWYFMLTLFGLSEWISYQLSALVITNQRLIDCQHVNFLLDRSKILLKSRSKP